MLFRPLHLLPILVSIIWTVSNADCRPLFSGLENNGTVVVSFSFALWKQWYTEWVTRIIFWRDIQFKIYVVNFKLLHD